MTVEFAEPISSIPSVLETDEKRMFSQVRSLKELKIEHEFKDSTDELFGYVFLRVARSSRNPALKTLVIMVETALKTNLIQPSYGSLS